MLTQRLIGRVYISGHQLPESGPNLDRETLPSEAKPFDIIGKKRKRRRIFKNLVNKALTGRMRPAQ